jgi:HK97 family phage major capsid protein
MRTNLMELRKQRQELLAEAEAIVSASENGRRAMTDVETANFNTRMDAVRRIDSQIEPIEQRNTLLRHVKDGVLIPGGPGNGPRSDFPGTKILSREYADDFYTMVRTNGKQLGPHLLEGSDEFGGYALPGFSKPSAALYESSNAAGGFAVPSMVDTQIVPLAPQEMAVRQLALVFPTSMDIRIPQKGSFGATTAKAENAAFTENDPTLAQITLSAFMAGNMEKISWELAQDVPAFQAFCVEDAILAQQMYEDNLYINGTGTGQAQGLIGNVGAGVTCGTHAYADILDSTFDVMGTLNAVYHRNAAFLMQRATAIGIRKAQKQANLFEPVFVRSGGQDYLHGYPVFYSAYMPAVGAAAKPILFGDFRQGYVIGDRGGSGINVKILDQPFAVNGQIALLVYRRTDGRVRRSEAIQTLATT